MQSQKYIDVRSGLIVESIPLLEMNHFVEYSGRGSAGDIDDNELLFGIDEPAIIYKAMVHGVAYSKLCLDSITNIDTEFGIEELLSAGLIKEFAPDRFGTVMYIRVRKGIE